MSKHTPGPWNFYGPLSNHFKGKFFAIGSKEKSVCQTMGLEEVRFPADIERQQADAARIVECVNAIEGIENPAAIQRLCAAAIGAARRFRNNGDLAYCVELEQALAALGVKS